MGSTRADATTTPARAGRWGAAALAAAGLASSVAAAAVMLDGKVEPPFEYVLHVAEFRKEPGKDGLSVLISVSRSADAYHLALRFPTTLTAEDLESAGGYSVAVLTAAGDPPGRTPILRIGADTPLGQKVDGVPGTQAVRRLDAAQGLLVVEIALAHGTYAVAADGSPMLRLEMNNANGAHGNANVGRQSLPARPEEGDALGLARLPADPRRAAASAALDELDSAIALAMGADEALAGLADLAETARIALSMPDGGSLKAELTELLEWLEAYAADGRIDAADAKAIRIAAETVVRIAE